MIDNPILSVEALTVNYLGREILRDISFAVRPNTVTSIVGPSGVGKSTLLRAFNRLLDDEQGFTRKGKICVRGEDIDSHGIDRNGLRRSVGLIFQRPVVFPITIFKNVIFGTHHLGLAPRKEYAALVERHLREAFLWDEVKDRLHRPALELSVGQQQRLAIARSLCVNPEILLMDEPTSALDGNAAAKIEELILALKENRTIILVTHQPVQARRLSERILALHFHDGAGEVEFHGDKALWI